MTNTELQRVQAQFETLLLQPLLQPMEEAFGGYGQMATQAFSDALTKALSA